MEQVGLIPELVKQGADVNFINEIGVTPLHIACSFAYPSDFRSTSEEHLATVKALLDAGACVNTGDTEDGMTALHFAASLGYVEVMKLLLYHNSDVNARDVHGSTPMHHISSSSSCGPSWQEAQSLCPSPHRCSQIRRAQPLPPPHLRRVHLRWLMVLLVPSCP